jgi:hypothetical protein
VIASSASSGGASSSSTDTGPLGAPSVEAVHTPAPPESLPISREAEEGVKVLPYLVDDADSEDIVALVGE